MTSFESVLSTMVSIAPVAQLPWPTPVMLASVWTSTTTSPTGPIHLRLACGLSPSALLYPSYWLITVTSWNSTNSPQDSVLTFVTSISVISIINLPPVRIYHYLRLT